jgi:hypothetical protein
MLAAWILVDGWAAAAWPEPAVCLAVVVGVQLVAE